MSKRCVWTLEEDLLLQELVRKNGAKRWALMAFLMHNKTGKQCRERWHNHLDPSIKKGGWCSEEDEIICEMVAKIGKKWACIARQLPGRTDNAVKNRYHSSLRKSLHQTGRNNSKTEEEDDEEEDDEEDEYSNDSEQKETEEEKKSSTVPSIHQTKDSNLVKFRPNNTLPSFEEALRGNSLDSYAKAYQNSKINSILPSFGEIEAFAQKGYEIQNHYSILPISTTSTTKGKLPSSQTNPRNNYLPSITNSQLPSHYLHSFMITSSGNAFHTRPQTFSN